MYRKPMTGLVLALVTLALGASLQASATMLPGPAALYAMPDLAILKYRSSDLTPFAPGNEISYQIYYINQGGYVANDVRIVDTLPEHTTFVSSSQPGFVLIQGGPDQVVWVRDRLSVFERGWLSVNVRVDDDAPVGGCVENTAYILCPDPESNYDNNESVLESCILPNSPDLAVHKELQAGTYGPDHVISTRIHYRNQGGSAAANVRITDTLPAGCTYVSDNNTYGWTTEMTGSTVVWTQPTVPTDSVGDVYVTFRLPAGWDPNGDWLENVAEIGTTDAEFSYDNNRSRLVAKPEAHRRYGAAVTAVDDHTMRLVSDAGFDYVLYYLDWSETEPSDNQYNWHRLDDAVWQAWWWNLRLVVRVDRAPDWARGPGTATAPPTTPAKLGEFLQATAARWPRTTAPPNRPQLHGYVVWNEPNLAAEWGGNAPDAAAYTNLLQAAYNGVKAGSANAWVISAGLATTNGGPDSVDDRTYLQAMYAAGAGAYFDRLGANPLGFASAPDDTSDPNGYDFSRALDWRAIMEANGDEAKDMFATEVGWLRDTANDLGSDYNWIKVSDVDQAHYLARAFHKASCEWQRPDGTPWMGPMMVWNLDLAAFDPNTSHRHWFSITDGSRDPLRAYYTLQNAATRGPADLWVETEHVGAVSASNLQYVIRYTNVGGQAAQGVVLSDTLPAGTAYVSDTGGGTPSGNQIVWTVGTVPTCTYETITLTLKLAGEGDPGGVLTNTVEANIGPGEPYADDNADEAIALVPDLHIEKVSQPSVVAAGDTITYVLTYRNDGQATATGVLVTDAVPGELIGVSYDSDPILAATPGFTYTWNVGTLTPGAGGTITVTGQVNPGLTPSPQQTFTNTALITGTTSVEVYHRDNSSATETTVNSPTGVALVALAATVSGNAITAIWGAVTALMVGIGLTSLLVDRRRRQTKDRTDSIHPSQRPDG